MERLSQRDLVAVLVRSTPSELLALCQSPLRRTILDCYRSEEFWLQRLRLEFPGLTALQGSARQLYLDSLRYEQLLQQALHHRTSILDGVSSHTVLATPIQLLGPSRPIVVAQGTVLPDIEFGQTTDTIRSYYKREVGDYYQYTRLRTREFEPLRCLFFSDLSELTQAVMNYLGEYRELRSSIDYDLLGWLSTVSQLVVLK